MVAWEAPPFMQGALVQKQSLMDQLGHIPALLPVHVDYGSLTRCSLAVFAELCK